MKVAVFAGIGRLGVPVAETLVDQGWKVVISYRQGKGSEKTAKQIIETKGSDNVIGVVAEISYKDEADKLIKQTIDQYGRVDALINIASWYPDEEKDWQRWKRGEGVNDNDWKYYESNFIPIRNSILAVLESETSLNDVSIINFVDARSCLYVDWDVLDPYSEIGGIVKASVEAIKQIGLDQLAQKAENRQINPYTLSKRDLVHLTRKLALDYEGTGLRINAVAPGPMLPPPDKTEEQSKFIIEQTVLKQWGHTKPIVDIIMYLLKADFVTGDIHFIDGGFYIYKKFKK